MHQTLDSTVVGRLILAKLYIYIQELQIAKNLVDSVELSDLDYFDNYFKAEYYFNSLGLIYCGLQKFDLSSMNFLHSINLLQNEDNVIKYKINRLISLLKEEKNGEFYNELKYLLNDSKSRRNLYTYFNIRFKLDLKFLADTIVCMEKDIASMKSLLISVLIPKGYYLDKYIFFII